MVYEKPFGTSPGASASSTGSCTGLRRVAGLPDRPLPRQGGHPGPAPAPVRQRAVRELLDRRPRRAVQIDVPETLDIDDRAEFYDATGAVLDMLVTHLFQVAAEVAMEPPRLAGRRPAVRPRGGDRRVPPAGPDRRGPRAVRGLPRPRASPPTRPPTPSSPPASGSTTTAGAGCRSCCAPARGWPTATRRSTWSSGPPKAPALDRRPQRPGLRPKGNGAIKIEMTVKKPGRNAPAESAPGSTWRTSPRGRCRRTPR